MFLTNFGLKYPKLAEKETRVVTILSDKEKIDKWEYVIQELYCTNKTCDCRKVSFNVIWPKEEIYYFDYWFEEPNYYMDWWIWDLDWAKEMSWLSVNEMAWNYIKSELFLNTIKWVLNDEKYIDRLKKHYFLMKEDVEWYEDPFELDDNEEDGIISLWDDVEEFEESNILKKKQIKERQKKKIAKKQKQKLRKKKKK